jgi:protein arginine kinase|uniref:Protein arginine kinase n=1 Tax=candidate division WOR-3 bacterium TaxID=2052148 RepID=A0A7V3RHH0_UNCW3
MFENIKWLISPELANECEEMEIVVSSRIRVARNVDGIPFEIKMKQQDAEKLVQIVKSALEMNFKGRYLNLQNIKPLEKESLFESHLISPAIMKKEQPTALFINEKGNIAIMVNEEDHLRIQGLSCGLNLTNIASEVYLFEEALGQELGYAYNENYGFITSCPTNLGTGLRASVLFHLPGLVYTNEIDKVLKSTINLGMNVRGIYGEGSEIKGNLFQISNQHTLGFKEDELIEKINKFARTLIDLEKKARDVIISRARYELEDKIFRSRAILSSARLISSDEVLNLLSAIRLGIGIGLINDIDINTVNEIMLITRPGNIQLFYGEILEEEERDIKRAEYIRNRLISKKS